MSSSTPVVRLVLWWVTAKVVFSLVDLIVETICGSVDKMYSHEILNVVVCSECQEK